MHHPIMEEVLDDTQSVNPNMSYAERSHTWTASCTVLGKRSSEMFRMWLSNVARMVCNTGMSSTDSEWRTWLALQVPIWVDEP